MVDSRRNLPSVDRVLAELRGVEDGQIGLKRTTEAVREVLSDARGARSAGSPPPSLEQLVAQARARLERDELPSLRPVINATGVILQTNLGRSPLSDRAISAMREAAISYNNLEYDLDTGTRGSRHAHLAELLRRTTGAEDAIVVNNNAAAVFMALQAFARGHEVIVSRGQAVEIGGGFRIPDVLRESGAILREVGTTNRTYARDYAEAWNADSAAILRVHSSNFRVVGFTAEPALGELADVAHRGGGLLLDDIGSGCLLDTTRFGMEHEPTVQESLAAGSDLTMFSGDKLLGGPQCGIIAGRAELIESLRAHPLARALRVDKFTIAALGATLQSYVNGSEQIELPIWRMLSYGLDTLRARAEAWAAAGGGIVFAAKSMVGGGSLPGGGVATWCAAFALGPAVDGAARALRHWSPAVVARIAEGRLLLDPRTVAPADDAVVEEALRSVVGAAGRDSS